MSRSCLLLWLHYTTWDLMMLYEIWARHINMPMCLNGKEHRYISNRLDCIWFKWCLSWMCLYTYVLWSCGILVCLYDQVMMSMVFLYSPKLWNICMLVWSWYDVVDFQDWMYLYICILRSCGISMSLYNQAMRSLIWYLEMPVCLYSPKFRNACILA